MSPVWIGKSKAGPSPGWCHTLRPFELWGRDFQWKETPYDLSASYHKLDPPQYFPFQKTISGGFKIYQGIWIFGHYYSNWSLFLTCLVGSTDAFYCILLQELFVLLIVPLWYIYVSNEMFSASSLFMCPLNQSNVGLYPGEETLVQLLISVSESFSFLQHCLPSASHYIRWNCSHFLIVFYNVELMASKKNLIPVQMLKSASILSFFSHIFAVLLTREFQ